MYVCLCNGITDRAVREAAHAGARNLPELTAMTGCASTCGSCAEVALQVLRDARSEQRFPLHVFSAAA